MTGPGPFVGGVPPSTATAREFGDQNGTLRVLEASDIPFEVRRLFFIEAPVGAIRGNHAHLAGHQFFVTVSGAIRVRVESRTEPASVVLLSTGQCLHIPPGLWASEEFVASNSVLLVLCDLPFDQDDYVRDYRSFKETSTQA